MGQTTGTEAMTSREVSVEKCVKSPDWTKWHWEMILFEYFSTILSVSFHQCSTFIFHSAIVATGTKTIYTVVTLCLSFCLYFRLSTRCRGWSTATRQFVMRQVHKQSEKSMNILSRIQNPDIIRAEYSHCLSPVQGRFITKRASVRHHSAVAVLRSAFILSSLLMYHLSGHVKCPTALWDSNQIVKF